MGWLWSLVGWVPFPTVLRQRDIETAIVVFGQAAPDPLSQLTGYGALGLVVIGAIAGQIRFKPEVTALREDMLTQAKAHAEDRQRMQTQIDTLLEVHQTQVLPALLASARALENSESQTKAMLVELARIADATRGRQ